MLLSLEPSLVGRWGPRLLHGSSGRSCSAHRLIWGAYLHWSVRADGWAPAFAASGRRAETAGSPLPPLPLPLCPAVGVKATGGLCLGGPGAPCSASKMGGLGVTASTCRTLRRFHCWDDDTPVWALVTPLPTTDNEPRASPPPRRPSVQARPWFGSRYLVTVERRTAVEAPRGVGGRPSTHGSEAHVRSPKTGTV